MRVCEREREGEREGAREQGERKNACEKRVSLCVCVQEYICVPMDAFAFHTAWVCVCTCGKERERESVCVRVCMCHEYMCM